MNSLTEIVVSNHFFDKQKGDTCFQKKNVTMLIKRKIYNYFLLKY